MIKPIYDGTTIVKVRKLRSYQKTSRTSNYGRGESFDGVYRKLNNIISILFYLGEKMHGSKIMKKKILRSSK